MDKAWVAPAPAMSLPPVVVPPIPSRYSNAPGATPKAWFSIPTPEPDWSKNTKKPDWYQDSEGVWWEKYKGKKCFGDHT